MCLDTVDKETKQVTEGWKVFNNGSISFIHFHTSELSPVYFFTPLFKCEEWIEDENNRSIKYNNVNYDAKYYKTGFHFYIDKLDAESWVGYSKSYVIKKVRVKNVVATGTQAHCKVGVARKIFIEN